MLSILSYVSGTTSPPWRSVCSVLCPFFNWIVCLRGMELCEFFIYFGDQTLVCGIIGKCVFSYTWFSFHFNLYAAFILRWVSWWLYKISLVFLANQLPYFFIVTFKSFTFKTFINLEFIFMYGVSWWSSFIFFARSCPDLPTPSVEEAVFSPFYAPASFVKY